MDLENLTPNERRNLFIELCSKIPGYENMNSANTTVAKRNRNKKFYWANPNIRHLKEDWYLLLYDINNKKLHIFLIPAGSIQKNQVKYKNKELLDIHINYDDKSFTDSRSGIKFNQWYKETIPLNL